MTENMQPFRGDAESDQALAHGDGAIMRQAHVLLRRAAIIGVADDAHLDVRLRRQPSRLLWSRCKE